MLSCVQVSNNREPHIPADDVSFFSSIWSFSQPICFIQSLFVAFMLSCVQVSNNREPHIPADDVFIF